MSNRYYDAGRPRVEGQQKVFLATPSYDDPDCSYTFSIARSREALTAAGIASAYSLLQGNAHVDDSRNAIVREFLLSDCTDLIFLDADVSWEPERLVTLCGYDKDIVGGVYPYRRESEKESMPVRLTGSNHEPDENGLIEVEGLPTGFMRIKRHVIETMAKTAKHFMTDAGLCPVLFERDFFGVGRRGGDIRFCMVWRDMGGKVYAASRLRLGHCGKHIIKDSLGASLRRQEGTSLRYLADTIRAKGDDLDTYVEACRAIGNKWGAPPDILQMLAGLARSAKGPVLEVGSGLSTVVIASAAQVWAIEHDPEFAGKLEAMASAAGVGGNINLVTTELKDGWYDLSADLASLPERFGLAFVDGPPRLLGDRMQFFNVFGDRCEVIVCDDANQPSYAEKLANWAKSRGRDIQIDDRAAVILPKSDGW